MSDPKELFDLCDENYLKFEEIPDNEKLHPNSFICACMYIYNRTRADKITIFEIAAEHDIVYLADIDDFSPEFNKEDALYLSRCGIHYDLETDSLANFT